MILALKFALLVTVSGLVIFTADYTRMTRGACWRDPVGLTLILKDIFLAVTLAPLLLAAFFQLSVLGSEIGSWVLIGFLFLAGAVVYWRLAVFELIYRRGRKARRAADGPGGTVPALALPDGAGNEEGAQP